MKNKNLHNPQLELIRKLLDSVNSKQEFNYLSNLYNIIQKGGVRRNGK